jgi:O-antigen/teichoic acid export membrane protein
VAAIEGAGDGQLPRPRRQHPLLRAMIWLSLPVVVICYFARGYMARLLAGNNAPEVALIFGFLTVAILFRTVYAIVSRYFYAKKKFYTFNNSFDYHHSRRVWFDVFF